jgi:hypothetical protein
LTRAVKGFRAPLEAPRLVQHNAARLEGTMGGALVVVWSVAGACMAAMILFEVGPSIRYRWRIRRRLRPLTRA